MSVEFKRTTILLLTSLLFATSPFAQDTFSIVAIDSVTGEVGSAGASCVDLSRTSLNMDDFIGVLFPGKGAINSQASYIPVNQNNATEQMNQGNTPSEIIQWLIDNDVQNRPEIRQYGIAALVDGKPTTAAHTGSETISHTGHRLGQYYSIQGNILKGPEVLDSMELRFLSQKGDLACRLMAAMEGANMVGADSRCASNGTSSLFAYLKVAQPDDEFGKPSFLISVRTKNGDRIEPVDSMRTLFEQKSNCTLGLDDHATNEFRVYPNPANDHLMVERRSWMPRAIPFHVMSLEGKTIIEGLTNREIDITELESGVYILSLSDGEFNYRSKFIKQ